MLADFRAVFAARMELAAGRRIDGAGNIALENLDLAIGVKVRRRNGVHQRLSVGVLGIVEQLLRVGQLDDIAQIHNADAVGDIFDDRQIVRDEQVRQILLVLQVFQQVDDLRLD